MGLRILSLYSGSSGNAFAICAPSGTLLIDAGKNAKHLNAALTEGGVDPARIGAILLTHEHSDHVSALAVWIKKHPMPIHLPTACLPRFAGETSVEPYLCPHPPIWTQEICGMTVTSFPTPHDSRGSVGYRIEIPTEQGVFRLGYATDLGCVTSEVEQGLFGCDAVILESNHDPEMLQTGPYPYELKRRIASRRGHLSNPDSACLASRLCASGTRYLLLAHLSRENNTPDIAFDECFGAVGDDGVCIRVAHPDAITVLFEEEDA